MKCQKRGPDSLKLELQMIRCVTIEELILTYFSVKVLTLPYFELISLEVIKIPLECMGLFIPQNIVIKDSQHYQTRRNSTLIFLPVVTAEKSVPKEDSHGTKLQSVHQRWTDSTCEALLDDEDPSFAVTARHWAVGNLLQGESSVTPVLLKSLPFETSQSSSEEAF
ncbi:hypothetical protein H671_1g0700 [Cricetulus griseus]|nr:hypothetical protein H671_1g0700 [Cricetulus griseus]